MNINQLKDSGHIIYSVTAGSHLYGLNIPTSDVDERGIYSLPIEKFIFPDHPKQISCETNDTVYYEVVRFLELAKQANPNIIELLFAPDHKVLWKTPNMDIILKHKEKFLTKACKNSLGGYAVAQIKKARGQNKMIVNPIVERKTVLDFCYITTYKGTVPLRDWLKSRRRFRTDQAYYGVSKVNNAKDVYYIYCDHLDRRYGFTGMVKSDESSNELRMSSIPKEIISDYNVMIFNKDGYTSHCKDYKQYQEWVEKRNPERYKSNEQHGKGYDSKNMMHCFRLLKMGIELAEEGTLNVYRKDRDFLLKIRSGEMEYDDLINQAEEMILGLDEKFDKSSLPSSIDDSLIKEMISEFKLS